MFGWLSGALGVAKGLAEKGVIRGTVGGWLGYEEEQQPPSVLPPVRANPPMVVRQPVATPAADGAPAAEPAVPVWVWAAGAGVILLLLTER